MLQVNLFYLSLKEDYKKNPVILLLSEYTQFSRAIETDTLVFLTEQIKINKRKFCGILKSNTFDVA